MRLIYINNIPHWEEDGVVLPVIAGGALPFDFDYSAGLLGSTGKTPPGGDGEGDFTFEQMMAFAERLLAGSSGSSGGFAPPTFGETREGFEFGAIQDVRQREFQAGESVLDRAAMEAGRIAGELHDKTLLGLSNDFNKLQQQRDQAFAKGEREAGQVFQERMNKIQQDFQRVEAQKDRDFQKELKKEELKAERQRIFVDMMGKDPIRAVLFAMGGSGNILPGGERFEDLPALKGARPQAAKATHAIRDILSKGGVQNVDPITIQSGIGVTDLPPAIRAAKAFQRTGAAGKNVLSSAFGIGDIRAGEQPGIPPEELLQIIQSVTPKGVLA